MPVSEAPLITSKEAFVPNEKPLSRDIDFAKWDEIGLQASRNAQSELHRKGLSYFIGRDGLVIEVLPSGEERVATPRHE